MPPFRNYRERERINRNILEIKFFCRTLVTFRGRNSTNFKDKSGVITFFESTWRIGLNGGVYLIIKALMITQVGSQLLVWFYYAISVSLLAPTTEALGHFTKTF